MCMKIRYHPLVDGDTDGKEKYPLFFTEDEATARAAYCAYLEEMVPGYYSLCRGSKKEGQEKGGFDIHCPRCGRLMDRISPESGTGYRPLYMCRDCTKERSNENG